MFHHFIGSGEGGSSGVVIGAIRPVVASTMESASPASQSILHPQTGKSN